MEGGYRKAPDFGEPSLYLTAWNAATLHASGESGGLTGALESLLSPKLDRFSGQTDSDGLEPLEQVNALAVLRSADGSHIGTDRIADAVDMFRMGDEYAMTPGGQPVPYATLLAADSLAAADESLPRPVLERLAEEAARLGPDALLTDIDAVGIPTLLPLVLSGEQPPNARELLIGWANTVGHEPSDGLTLALTFWLARASAFVDLPTHHVSEMLAQLRAAEGGWATGAGGSFDAKATFFAVSLGAELSPVDRR